MWSGAVVWVQAQGVEQITHFEMQQDSLTDSFSPEDPDSKHMEREALNRRNVWEPSPFYSLGKETFFFTGQEISIRESLDSYGAVIWPGVRNLVCNSQLFRKCKELIWPIYRFFAFTQAVALCKYLEKNREQIDLMDKAVLELGAGTGLVSIVTSLLGRQSFLDSLLC